MTITTEDGPLAISQVRINDLRRALDYFESNEDLRCANADGVYVGGLRISIVAYSEADFARLTRALGGSLADPVVKDSDDHYLRSIRKFGAASIEVFISRVDAASCVRVPTGTHKVEKPIMVQQGTEVVDETIYEWVCPPILSHASDAPAPTTTTDNNEEPF